MSDNKSDALVPRYVEVAHWLYEQQRFLSARETATQFGDTPWSMGYIFAKIRRRPDIFVFDERQVRISGGKQILIRVNYIRPYRLDEKNQIQRQCSDRDNVGRPLTWHDLLCCKWSDLIDMQRDICSAIESKSMC
ncbi:hypothetical protein ACEUAY_18655 [Aeromonas veronii]